MASLGAVVRIRTTPVTRNSDGKTVLIVEAWCGTSNTPILLQIVEPDD